MRKAFDTRTLWIGFALALLVGVAPAHAQEGRHWTFNIGAGFSPVTGQISQRLQNGWNFTVGGGYRFTRHFEANVQYAYNGFGVQPAVLREAQVPAANSHLWSLTVDPKLHVHPFGKVDPYFVGAVGYFRRTIQFTQPTLTTVLVYDPFFDFFPFPELVPADVVLGNITHGGVGGNLGAGFDFPFPWTARIFVEARYQYAATGDVPTRMIPITIGIQW